MFDIFIHTIRKIYVGTDTFYDSRSTQELFQSITNLKQEWKVLNRNTFILTPYILFENIWTYPEAYQIKYICGPSLYALSTLLTLNKK